MSASIHIGTQGWNYDGWTGPFYPRGTTKKEMLSLYAKVFDTIEIDSSFYAIPAENSVRGWLDKTPSHFTFSLKLPSEITHQNRLRGSEGILESFVERIRLFQERLGCVLIQLPPDFPPTERRALAEFLKLLPSDIRFAVEFRDAGWMQESTASLLREHHVALALVDSKWIDRRLSFQMLTPTASFAYVRWLGPRELTDFSRIQIDKNRELQEWADAFAELKENATHIFGYFNNHYQGHSPASCNQFKRLLGLSVEDAETLIAQPSLF
ncbi:MAG TPA: DUF72 domain-containing protein [Blastocatellia bacterium]|nr:DUF72 domain-containing protein [Blastocatellia bacterium]